uniref:RING-type domain-containing protein n=1 Tax=Oryza meridionalis TaxID=40149 RepID=A0A0E0D1E3_9ORYZ
METEEDDHRLHPRTRTIADLLNQLDQIHSTSATRTTGGGGGVAPASDEAIEALKDFTGDIDQLPAECAICLHGGLDAAAAPAGWKEMPCGHRFHGGCLEKWLRVHGTCPMCRHQMPTTTAPPPPAAEQEDYLDGDEEEDAGDDDDEVEAGVGPLPLELRVVVAHSSGGYGGVAASASTTRRLLAWSTTI